MRPPPQPAPDYTNAFLVTSALILFMAFLTLAATKGFVWVLLSATLIELGLRLRTARILAATAR